MLRRSRPRAAGDRGHLLRRRRRRRDSPSRPRTPPGSGVTSTIPDTDTAPGTDSKAAARWSWPWTICPAEIPLESSVFFSQALKPFLPAFGQADFGGPSIRSTASSDQEGDDSPPRAADSRLSLPSEIPRFRSPTRRLRPLKPCSFSAPGFVAGPLVRYFLDRPDVKVRVGDLEPHKAAALAARITRGRSPSAWTSRMKQPSTRRSPGRTWSSASCLTFIIRSWPGPASAIAGPWSRRPMPARP